MLEPYYQIFKDRLKEVKFKDMKTLFPTVDKFVKKKLILTLEWITMSNCIRY